MRRLLVLLILLLAGSSHGQAPKDCAWPADCSVPQGEGLLQNLPRSFQNQRHNNTIFYDFTHDWEISKTGTTTYFDGWVRIDLGCSGASGADCDLNRYATDLQIPNGTNATSGVQYQDSGTRACIIGDTLHDDAGEHPFYSSWEVRVLRNNLDNRSWVMGIGASEAHITTAGVTTGTNYLAWKYDEAEGDGILIPVYEGATGGEIEVACPDCVDIGETGFIRLGAKMLNDGDQAWWYVDGVQVASHTPDDAITMGGIAELGWQLFFGVVRANTSGGAGILLDYAWCNGKRGFSQYDSLHQVGD